MVQLILTAILLGLLTACGSGELMPSKQIVQQAIALQFGQTQQQIVKQLYSDSQPQKYKINRVAIAQQEPLEIQNLPSYRVRGTYDLEVQLPKRWVTQQQHPFDVYLQRQIEGKTWRLAIPQLISKDTKPIWLTYLIR